MYFFSLFGVWRCGIEYTHKALCQSLLPPFLSSLMLCCPDSWPSNHTTLLHAPHIGHTTSQASRAFALVLSLLGMFFLLTLSWLALYHLKFRDFPCLCDLIELWIFLEPFWNRIDNKYFLKIWTNEWKREWVNYILVLESNDWRA